MKKFTMFMAFLLLISWQGMAQISTYYSFSELNSPYVEITGGTIDLVADSDDGEVINVPIGFSFNYAGTLYTSLTIGVNGALSFTSNDVSFTNSLSATGATQTNVIAPLWDDMYFRTVDNAEIMYLTTGTAPNRVFTVQWKNISWRNAGNTVNFQVQLFENTNNIQFNYGALNSTDSRTASIGFNKGTSGTDFISVTPGIPATSSYITDDNNINTTQYPGTGAVYLFTFTPPACPDPSVLSATNLTATSADLTWTEMGSATTWDIEWGTAGFTPTGTPNIVGTTTNPHNLTGLTANTSYDFYVRADCAGNGTSNWSGPYNFTTPCASVIAPWVENFENAGSIPACWSQGTSNNENWLFTNTGSGNHIGDNGTITGTTTSGNYFAWVDDSSPHNSGTTLESPFIDVSALTNPMLSFFLISNNETYTNVNFSVDVWDGTAWNTGVYTSNSNTLNGGWEQIDVYFTSLTITGDIKLRFIVDENNGTDFYDDVAIDDVEIKEAPACPAPTALTVTNITATTTDLGWTENGSATTWDIEWGAAGFTPTGTPNIVGTTTNPHNLTGLTALTSYDFYVRADCAGNGTSNWSGPYNFTTTCAAPLAGNYTIGASGNYPTFTDAVNALLACGISAPVVFDVLTGSGPYNEQVAITPITGASATNTITFNGNGETITSSTVSASRSLFLFDGAKHVTINDLVFVPQSSTNNFTVQLTNGADSNTVNNCTIDLTAAISSTVTSNAGIVISGSLTSATSTTQPTGNYNTISNNTVIGGYYGITLSGANNNVVSNNDVQDFYTTGIYHNTANSNEVSNNKISRPNRTSITTFNGIYYTGGGENNLAEANEIFNPMGGNTTSTSSIYPIYHTGVDATVGNENKVINNIIHSINGNGIIYGLYNSGSDGVFYYHNTVSLDDANATAGTTRGFYQLTTASGIEFKNNIITITRGGTGTKYCIYFGATGSTITSDNNVFYINAPAGTNNLGYFGADQATLVDWQTASSQDASSSDADPIYANLLSNDYTPTNSVIDNMADASVGVANDFFGAARAATPDVGAIEFTPPACAQPSNLVVTNITNSSVDLGWTENGTATIWDIEWGTAGFTPTGTPNIVGTTTNPHNLTGLTDLTTYEFYVRADCGATESAWSGPFSFTTTCGTPLAGNYTIGASGNYATFTDAVNALLACGISAPVVFDVLTGSGPYNEQVAITPITGASATNTITFNGNGETITSSTVSASRSLFLFDGAKHVTINDLVFVPQSSTNNFTVQLTNGADSNTVNNCTIDLTAAISSTSSTNAGIVISGSLTSATSTTQPTGNYNIISNNTVIGGYYGITVAGGNNNNITNNDVQDVYYYGIYHSAVNNTNTSNNKVSRPNRTSVSTSAYYAIYYTGSSENNLTNANELFNPLGSTTSTPTTYLIGHSSADATVGNENIVTNNIIHSVSGNATVYGLYNSGSDGVFYYHNTVSLDDASATSGTTRGFYQLTTASGIEFKNNIITITRGGTGTKYCIYFGATGSTITSDNNVFYINAPAGTNNLGYFSATAQATLVDWQTASTQDAISSDADPLYVNLSVNDLTPSNPAVDGIADASVGVASDFFGAARAATPDPGAIEFTPPACPQPSALTATNITATTADLGWTENGTATTWDIEWGTVGFTPTGTPNIVGTTTNPHNLTGLTAQTSYEFYVRSICGTNDTSAWSGPYVFTTPCNTVTTFPFLEDFETTSTTRDCWTQIEELGSASWTYATGSSGGAITTAYSGTENARFVSQSGTNSPIVKLVSPILDLSGVNSPELAFFYGQEIWFSDQNELKVYYRVSVDSAWVQIAHYTSDVAVWTADTLTLPNPSATYQIAFEGINNWGRANVVDDVEVYDAFTCSDPSNLTAFNIQPTNVMLDWTENGTATNWNIEWDVTGFTLGTGNPQAVAAKPYLLQGLTPGTAYDYYVQADCGMGDTSNWVGPYTFTTPPCMPIGLNLGADTTLCANQNITLDAGAGPYTYTWSTGGSAQTEVIDTTLMGGNGTYNVSVTVVDNVSGCIYTDDINITFQTCTNIDELNGANAFNIYPNPTKGILSVSMASTTANTVLTIVDVQGKVVFTKTNFNTSSGVVETIDLSGNDKGIYFVNFTNEQTSIVKKVVLH